MVNFEETVQNCRISIEEMDKIISEIIKKELEKQYNEYIVIDTLGECIQ